eukprot:TRINITY_DN40651_c0_g1_i1.p2 TRINITY_DN40651_c0_g1~~TRINITY_DN40651_c0_g1_i1.p2  ORF type:complete len:108 (+),score=8.32 TRINITY_DN40651_c0_g1_i1:1946-2269(+)
MRPIVQVFHVEPSKCPVEELGHCISMLVVGGNKITQVLERGREESIPCSSTGMFWIASEVILAKSRAFQGSSYSMYAPEASFYRRIWEKQDSRARLDLTVCSLSVDS